MHFLKSTAELARFCDEARSLGPLGLDMEFERERTYRPVLQLIQIASTTTSAIVDPLNLDDLGPLWTLIEDPEAEVILHAGSQDMEIFVHESGRLPQGIFDTQVAAALLGMGEQPGYADLVKRVTGVRLRKGERTTDWGRRPLSDAQIEYALDDVRYLHQLRERLHADLVARQRESWLAEELEFFTQADTYAKDPQKLWLRIPRHRSLSPQRLAILRELVAWREKTAATRDVPRGRVVPDDVLLDLARRGPKTIESLSTLRRLHPNEIRKGGDEILAAIERGGQVPEAEWPKLPSIPDDDPELLLSSDLMAVYVRYRARELQIAASYIATKKDLVEFARRHHDQDRGRTPLPLQTGWRHELVGHELSEILQGHRGLGVDPARGGLRVLGDLPDSEA